MTRRKPAAVQDRAREVIARLERAASKRVLDDMSQRYGIVTAKALGVPMAKMLALAKELGRDHELAAELWADGGYEARTVAALIEEIERVTPAQMDRWVRDFDNWGLCDTVCFKLFDRSPHAFAKVEAWSRREAEFEKRAAFALLASVALHDKSSSDAPFLDGLSAIERAAEDERNFIAKGVSWALRSIGLRSIGLHAASLELARKLAATASPSARRTGKEALAYLGRPAVSRRFAAPQRARSKSSKA